MKNTLPCLAVLVLFAFTSQIVVAQEPAQQPPAIGQPASGAPPSENQPAAEPDPAGTQRLTRQVAPPPTQAQLSADVTAFAALVARLQEATRRTANDLNHLRIDKWKADSNTKQQAQSNSESIRRNIENALPGIMQQAQAFPQDIGPNFKLYRNINALYDVLASLAESAGAFGPKDQYDPIATDVAAIDELRRSLADRFDWLATMRDSEAVRLRMALAQAQSAPTPVKKITADEERPAPKPQKKKAKTGASSSKPKSSANQ